MKINLSEYKRKGRPRKGNTERKNTHIKVYVPESVKNAFADFCEAQSTTCSSYLGNIVSQILSGGSYGKRKD